MLGPGVGSALTLTLNPKGQPTPRKAWLPETLTSEAGSGRTTAIKNGIAVLPISEDPLREQAPFMRAPAANGRVTPFATNAASCLNGKYGL